MNRGGPGPLLGGVEATLDRWEREVDTDGER